MMERVLGGRYRLIDKVGSGGMGTVWRARDELLGRTVAVKEVDLPAHLGAAERAELLSRTMREARAAARLSHPNAVTVHDVIEEHGQPWIVMAMVASDSLSEALATTGALPPRRVAEIGLAVLNALEAAHAAGILHRDVKPANVLLGHDGRIVLTDFGVATVEGDPALTGTGMLLGSPAYIAPERALGEEAGPASDLWSLGATLYAAVEGRPPYDRPTPMATLAALATEHPPAPRAAGPLTAALDGLLQRDPQHRLDAPAARRLLRGVLSRNDKNQEQPERGWTAVAKPPAAVPTRVDALPDPARPEPTLQDPWAPPSAAIRSPALPRPPRRLLRVAMLSLLVLAVVCAVVAGVIIADSSSRRTSASPGGGGSSGALASATPRPAPTITSAPDSSIVPAGFTRFTHRAGWSAVVPAGWRFEPLGGSDGRFVSPSGDVKLQFSSAVNPTHDPLASLRLSDETYGREPGYERHFLGSVHYRNYRAADWDYTQLPDQGGPPLRVRERNFRIGVTENDIELSAPASSWSTSLRYFDVATASFKPAA